MSDATPPPDPGTVRVGVVGLGAMGLPIALNAAAAGWTVRGCDRSAPRQSAAAAAGLDVDSLDTIADWATHVLVILRDDRQVDALFHDGGATPLPSGVVAAVMSTVGPVHLRALSSHLADKGVTTVDAPILSGNDQDAAAARLDIVVAGPDPAATTIARVLASSGEATIVGDHPGAAQAAKLTCQIMQAAGIVATLEALGYAADHDLDEATIVPLLRRGSARSWALDNLDRVRRMWARPGDPFDLIYKDLVAALTDGLPRHLPLPLTGEITAQFQRSGPIAPTHDPAEEPHP